MHIAELGEGPLVLLIHGATSSSSLPPTATMQWLPTYVATATPRGHPLMTLQSSPRFTWLVILLHFLII
ncbi:hypothetical protein LIER_14036 [Lithospermum erythrorhizon]|uniref:Uncharacterized protein n=1 Tax=Lithospermum erythrorhizon TaxID=34254 RepID=A0AAV3PYK5_LITER